MRRLSTPVVKAQKVNERSQQREVIQELRVCGFMAWVLGLSKATGNQQQPLRLIGMHMPRICALVAPCRRCSTSSTLRCGFHTNCPNSSNSSSNLQREGCNSGVLTDSAAADAWRGTGKQKEHYRRRQQQQQQIISREQKLLSAAAARWQSFWHRDNPYAPQASQVECGSSSNSCNSRLSNSSSKDVVHVVLINLGSPSQPTYTAVWNYLRHFLSDRRVVELPRVVWLPLLHLVVLPFRAFLSAKRYSSIWLSAEDVKERLSAAAAALQQRQTQAPLFLQQQVRAALNGGAAPPLLVHLLSLAARLQHHLDQMQQQQIQLLPRFEVVACVRYGNPSIASCLQQLQQQHRQLKLLLVPLYPQPTASCTGSAFDAAFDELKKWRVMPDLRVVGGYWNNEAYIHAVASSIKRFWGKNGRGQHLLFSYHGIPREVSWTAGDPYACLCFQTTRLVAQRLGLKAGEYEIAMQSRAGCSEWTQPYLIPALEALARAGCRVVDVVLPGFAADCLETLEEIQTEAADIFRKHAGGMGELRLIPCLNASDEAVAFLEALVLDNTVQWRTKGLAR